MVNDIIIKSYKLLEPMVVEFKIKHNNQIITLEGKFTELRQCLGIVNEYSLCGDSMKIKECGNEPNKNLQ